MKHKIFLLAATLLMSWQVFAQSGTCGDNLEWKLSNGVLTISGTGAMYDYFSSPIPIPIPWYDYRSSIQSVVIADGVTSIGNHAFYNCSALTSVTIPNSVTSIGERAFSVCISLTSITIPNSVTSIGDNAFYYCKGLTSVTIPNSITSIGNGAFYDCTSLTSVTIPNSVTSIGTNAFSGCTSLPVIDNLRYADTYLVEAVDETLTTYTIKEGTKWIGSSAFHYCSSLTSITIPNSVTSIGDYAFSLCRSLTSITIPNSVTSIGTNAFQNCSALTSITIPNSVTSIGIHAFGGCSSLTSVTIPNSVTSIGERAFARCSSLTSVTNYATTPQEIDDYSTFDDVDKSTCILYVPLESIELYKAAEGWEEFEHILPIGASATNVKETTVTPSETTAEIAWLQVSGAASYELVIRDKQGNIICTLVFDGEGRLLSLTFHAPAKDNAPSQTQQAGFVFTVTGLDSGATYTYTLTAKDAHGNAVHTESGQFTTEDEPQGVENVPTNQLPSTKVLRNGQVLILRGDKIYTMQGQEVK